MISPIPVNFLLYTAASITEYETISFDGEKVVIRTILFGPWHFRSKIDSIIKLIHEFDLWSQVSLEEGTRFDPGKLSKVVVHGWGGGLHLGTELPLDNWATGPNSDEYLNSAYMEAGLDFNILGVDWREMEGPAKTQVSCISHRVSK